MTAMLYAVVPPRGALPALTGVRQSSVQSISAHGLRLLYSELGFNEPLPMPDSALQFHRVLNTLLQELDFIPFRFQTCISEQALSVHLEQNAEAYRCALDAISGCVQMEVLISRAVQTAAASAPSGREYLQRKAQREHDARIAAEVARENLNPYVQEWQAQATSDGCRLYALVRRSELHQFQQHSQKLSPPGTQLRVTGPWPASAFISVQPQVGSSIEER